MYEKRIDIDVSTGTRITAAAINFIALANFYAR